ncbi:MAG: hypothetical protein ACJA0H_000891 [Francisellaceae bacterium]|jgi:hypothetical protein
MSMVVLHIDKSSKSGDITFIYNRNAKIVLHLKNDYIII